MEMLHVVHPETGEPVGEAMSRADVLACGAWCRSTNVFVLNPQGEVLCHKRSAEKERLPGVWTTHLGGHVGVGETYETNAEKELFEEAGLSPKLGGIVAWRTTRLDRARLWMREFVTVADRDTALVPQPGEVDEFRWLSPEDVLRASAADPVGWCAGTHDFAVEYQCMRAALAAAGSAGMLRVPEGLSVWLPRPTLA